MRWVAADGRRRGTDYLISWRKHSNLAPKRVSNLSWLVTYRESRLEVSRSRVMRSSCCGCGTGNGVGVGGGGAGGRGRRGCRGVVLQELAGRVQVQVVGKILDKRNQ